MWAAFRRADPSGSCARSTSPSRCSPRPAGRRVKRRGGSEPLASAEPAPTATPVPPTSTPVPPTNPVADTHTRAPHRPRPRQPRRRHRRARPTWRPRQEAGENRHQGTIPDVTMYRGNAARTGEMPGPDPDGQVGELWRVDLEQTIQSSPAVVNGVLFIGNGTTLNTNGAVVALDATSGKEIWRYEIAPFLSSPTVLDDRVYIASVNGDIYVLDAHDGEFVARFDANAAGCITGSSPAMDGPRLFISLSCSGPTDADGYATKIGKLLAFDRTKGTELWRFTSDGEINYMMSPAIDEGIVAIADEVCNPERCSGTTYAIDSTTGDELWRFEAATGFASTPVIDEGLVFVLGRNGTVFALDLATGLERWRSELEPGDISIGSLAVKDGVLYGVVSYSLHAIEVRTGRELWNVSLEGKASSAPVVTESAVYVGNLAGDVFAVDREDGRKRSISAGGRRSALIGSPVVSEGIIVAGAGRRYVIALGDLRTIVPIAEDMLVEVIGDSVHLLAAPSSGAVVRAELQAGTQLQVIGPAEERAGQTWWPVEAEGVGTGWVPAAAIVAADVTPESAEAGA